MNREVIKPFPGRGVKTTKEHQNQDMPGIPDEQIIELFRDKNKREEAFASLVNKYQRPLYWHIRKMVINHEDADDTLQNTLVKIYKSLAKFRQDSSLYTWLYRIATNESINTLNKQKKLNLYSLEDKEDYIDQQLESDPYFNGNEAQKQLQKAIQALPEKQRLVFNMKYFDEMKYEDMSKILGVTTGALKASYHHAVKKIEEMLKEH